jgi:hypothetical protein
MQKHTHTENIGKRKMHIRNSHTQTKGHPTQPNSREGVRAWVYKMINSKKRNMHIRKNCHTVTNNKTRNNGRKKYWFQDAPVSHLP